MPDRRRFLQGMGVVAGLGLTGQVADKAYGIMASSFDYPFTLGVASGDPGEASIVLWTRLAPDPLNGGGMPAADVPVAWTLATDPELRQVVRRGEALASAGLGHAVHVTVTGLQPAHSYYYGFTAGGHVSRLGRTRTLPGNGSAVEELSFAFASCQEYEFGYYAAYRHMAAEKLDFVLHLGDYIYEGGHINPQLKAVRQHDSGEIVSLAEYRNRYALYKLDPDLQAAHAAFPFIHMWDDHEVDNDWAGDTPTDPEMQSRDAFMVRRAVAAQAFYEHLPLSDLSRPRGTNIQLYRQLKVGNLAAINLLDTRQYRSDQPCGLSPRRNPPVLDLCDERRDSTLTMTGDVQEKWLLDKLARSDARWNVIAQPGWFSQLLYRGSNGQLQFHNDQWDGYPVQRQRILDFLATTRPSNVVLISGDWHINGVMDVKHHFDDPDSELLAAEFGGTSISSVGPWAPETIANMPLNPHVRFIQGDDIRQGKDVHGYVSCHVNPLRWRTEFRVLDTVKARDSDIQTAATFVQEDGRPGARRVASIKGDAVT